MILIWYSIRDEFLILSFFSVPDGEPIKLPDSLESLPKSEHFPAQRHRWNTNEVSEREEKGVETRISTRATCVEII